MTKYSKCSHRIIIYFQIVLKIVLKYHQETCENFQGRNVWKIEILHAPCVKQYFCQVGKTLKVIKSIFK